MAVDFNIKQNDTRPAIVGTLSCASTDVITDVQFKMANKAGTLKVDHSGGIQTQPSSSSGGQVKYQWLTGDTDTSGDFRAHFVVTFNDGRIETFPNQGYINVHVEQAL